MKLTDHVYIAADLGKCVSELATAGDVATRGVARADGRGSGGEIMTTEAQDASTPALSLSASTSALSDAISVTQAQAVAQALALKRLVPRWVGPIFALGALALIPWVAYLGVSLPATVRVAERTAWIGFDIGLMAMFALTAVLAHRRSPRVAQAASATATMLVVDAWFDIFTSGGGAALTQALQLGVVEVACAAACIWISFRAGSAVRAVSTG
jgi:hypothetical protein